jgi:hypothetical protein
MSSLSLTGGGFAIFLALAGCGSSDDSSMAPAGKNDAATIAPDEGVGDATLEAGEPPLGDASEEGLPPADAIVDSTEPVSDASSDAASDAPEEAAPDARPPTPGVSVLTRSYNNARTGANTAETILNQANVNPNQFGRLFQVQLDDQIFAQVLYVAGLSVNGAVHDVLYVATMNNTIYALDAGTGAVLWTRNFNGAGRAARISDSAALQQCFNFTNNFGTTSTPVIDAVTGTMYFVTHTFQTAAMVYQLEAIDITTGHDRPSSPVTIQPGGTPFEGGAPAFDPAFQNQRAGLGLSNGTVYVAFASYCDFGQYHGWVLAYDASTLASVGVYNTTPTGSQGGIWQGGAAPAIDSSGNVYVASGNGTTDQVTNFAETLVKLAPRTLTRQSYFGPAAFATLNNTDMDLASAGPSLVPGTDWVMQGGKTGVVYLMNTANLGGIVTGDTQVVQAIQAVDSTARPTATHHIHNTVVPWDGPNGLEIFVWGENDYLRQYQFNPSTQQFTTPASAVGAMLPPVGMPGGILAVSSNGAQAGTGIVWTTTPSYGDSINAITPGIVRAFNAETLALLWDSRSPGDDPLAFAKYNPVTVANGRVYVPSFSGVVSAYGPRTGPPPPVPNAIYSLRPGTGTGLCVGIPGGSGTEAAAAQQLTCDGTGSQRWQLTNLTNNVYQVQEVSNGKCLDVAGGSGAAGAAVGQYTCNGTLAQQWALTPLGSSQYALRALTGANLCLDVNGGSAASGSAIQIYTCNGTAAQNFMLAFDAQGTEPIPNGSYRVYTLTGPNLCIDGTVNNAGTYTNIGNVAQDTCSGIDSQRWRFQSVGGNNYTIRAAASELCLDVAGGSATSGSVIQQFSCNQSNAQVFAVEAQGTSRYLLMPQTAGGECMAVQNASANNGTPMVEAACDGTVGQSFLIVAP